MPSTNISSSSSIVDVLVVPEWTAEDISVKFVITCDAASIITGSVGIGNVGRVGTSGPVTKVILGTFDPSFIVENCTIDELSSLPESLNNGDGEGVSRGSLLPVEPLRSLASSSKLVSSLCMILPNASYSIVAMHPVSAKQVCSLGHSGSSPDGHGLFQEVTASSQFVPQ